MVVLSGATGAFSWLVCPMFQFVFKGGALDASALRTALPFLPDAASLPRSTILKALPILIMTIAVVRGAAYFVQFYCMGMLGQRVGRSAGALRQRRGGAGVRGHLRPRCVFARRHAGAGAARHLLRLGLAPRAPGFRRGAADGLAHRPLREAPEEDRDS